MNYQHNIFGRGKHMGKGREGSRERVEAIRQFIKDNGGYFSLDKEDFRRGKFYASGSGWRSDLGRSWGEGRVNAHLDIVSPICDSTVNSFTRNPFLERVCAAVGGERDTQLLRLQEPSRFGRSHY